MPNVTNMLIVLSLGEKVVHVFWPWHHCGPDFAHSGRFQWNCSALREHDHLWVVRGGKPSGEVYPHLWTFPICHQVKVSYKNTTDTAFPLTLPGCTELCPIDKFIGDKMTQYLKLTLWLWFQLKCSRPGHKNYFSQLWPPIWDLKTCKRNVDSIFLLTLLCKG